MDDPLRDIPIRCIACDKKLSRETDNPYWDWCVAGLIIGSYGSRHDLKYLLVGICDDCVAAKLASGVIFDAGNGLQHEDEATEAQRRVVKHYTLSKHPSA